MSGTPAVDDPVVKAMRLRADPPRPLRLSRKVALAGLGGLALAVAGALGVGLIQKEETGPPVELTPASVPPPDAVRALPGDYAAPQLGPPLPGDLGRPVLNAREAVGVEPGDAPAAGAQAEAEAEAARAAEARHAERERRRIETQAALTSAVLLPQAASVSGGGATTVPTAAAPVASRSDAAVAPSLLAGAVIEAGLVTGIRSDLPGPVLAQITADVHDSLTGRRLLIPRGSRLIGAHNAQVSQGQSRVQVLWSRLILPDGRTILLDGQTASDPQGYAGLEDRTDSRWGERLSAAALTTLLAVSGAAVDVETDDRLARAIRDGAVGGVDAVGRGLVERGLSLPPRLTIRPGFAFRIILTEDLDLPPYGD